MLETWRLWRTTTAKMMNKEIHLEVNELGDHFLSITENAEMEMCVRTSHFRVKIYI